MASPTPSGTQSGVSAAGLHQRNLWLVFTFTFGYFLVEVVAGVLTGSLALLSDAAHMLTDVGGLGLALFATWMSSKPPTARRSFGYYRVEIFSALINALVLFGISFYILYEAYRRFQSPPAVESGPMILVALVGLGINLAGMYLLRQGSKESLNLKGAFFEVVSDMLSSVGVLIAGAVMSLTGWYYADPLFSVVIGLFILPRTYKLMKEAIDILLQATPQNLDVTVVEQTMRSVPGIESVHDLHVWTLTSGILVMSSHVVVQPGSTMEQISDAFRQVNSRLKDQFGISHVAIQPELDGRCSHELTF